MRVFIEGYDTKNWGDVLMATASSVLARKLSPSDDVVFPRKLPYSDMNYGKTFSDVNVTVDNRKLPRWKTLFQKPPAQFSISPAARDSQKGDVVLYCNGYIFGDPWQEKWIADIDASFRRLKRRGVKIVLMPASFGPFEDENKARLVRSVVDSSAIVFARDSQSYGYAKSLNSKQSELFSLIDYTGMLNELPTFREDVCRERRVSLIPNVKIRERFGAEVEERYISLLAGLAQRAQQQHALDIAVVVHTRGKDDRLAELVASRCGDARVVRGDPLEIRKFVRDSEFVVTSRFHGLMNALSQNVPAISLGWTHKYDELMRAYGMDDFSINILSHETPLDTGARLFAEKETLVPRLEQANAKIRETKYADLQQRLASVFARA